MSEEEILNKYIDLIDKGYCSDCNELNCIDNFPHSKITHAIRELQHENKKYKEAIDKAIEYIKEKARNNCWIDQYESCDLIKILKEVE